MSTHTEITRLKARMRNVLILSAALLIAGIAWAGWFVIATFSRIADATAGPQTNGVLVRQPDPLAADALRLQAATRRNAPRPELEGLRDPFRPPSAAPAQTPPEPAP